MWRNNPVNSIDPSGELITRISGASGNWGIVIDRSCNTYKHFIELALEDLQRRIPKCVKPGRLKDCLNEITFTIKCKRCNAAGYTRVPFVRDTIGLCIPHAFTGENGPLGAIILHEMVHLCTPFRSRIPFYGENLPKSCEEACYGEGFYFNECRPCQ